MRLLAPLLLLALLTATTSCPAASAEAFKAEIYENHPKDTQHEKLLFKLIRKDMGTSSQLTTTAEFAYPDGKLAASEEAVLENGKVKKYVLNQLQLNEKGSLEVRDGIAYFSYTRNGRTKTDQEKATDNLIVGPNTVEFIQANWDKILRGEEVEARFAVLERTETVGFKFFKSGEAKSGDQERVRVQMKPTSFIIAALVDPLNFNFDKKTGRLLEMRGRTLPKLRVNDKWKDLDAHITYSYSK